MLKFIFITSFAILAACGSSKNVASEQTEQPAIAEQSVMSEERPLREEDLIDIEGTVRMNDKGCPFYIELIEGDLFSLVYPVNLDDKYKVDGKKLTFNYTPSRAQAVIGCEVQRVVSVSDVREK